MKKLIDHYQNLPKYKKHLITIKCIIGIGLVVNHFYPSYFGLITNLLWLMT
jgi:hypothetical protein